MLAFCEFSFGQDIIYNVLLCIIIDRPGRPRRAGRTIRTSRRAEEAGCIVRDLPAPSRGWLELQVLGTGFKFSSSIYPTFLQEARQNVFLIFCLATSKNFCAMSTISATRGVI